MRIVQVCALALLSVACAGGDSTSPQGASLSGYWCDPQTIGPSALVLTQIGSSVSGKVANYYYSTGDTSIVTGTVSHGTVSMVLGKFGGIDRVSLTGPQPGFGDNAASTMTLTGSDGGHTHGGTWFREPGPALVNSSCANRYP